MYKSLETEPSVTVQYYGLSGKVKGVMYCLFISVNKLWHCPNWQKQNKFGLKDPYLKGICNLNDFADAF